MNDIDANTPKPERTIPLFISLAFVVTSLVSFTLGMLVAIVFNLSSGNDTSVVAQPLDMDISGTI